MCYKIPIIKNAIQNSSYNIPTFSINRMPHEYLNECSYLTLILINILQTTVQSNFFDFYGFQ